MPQHCTCHYDRVKADTTQHLLPTPGRCCSAFHFPFDIATNSQQHLFTSRQFSATVRNENMGTVCPRMLVEDLAWRNFSETAPTPGLVRGSMLLVA
jgi:hypothetical protein